MKPRYKAFTSKVKRTKKATKMLATKPQQLDFYCMGESNNPVNNFSNTTGRVRMNKKLTSGSNDWEMYYSPKNTVSLSSK